MRLIDVFPDCGTKHGDIVVSGVSADSRKIKKGDVFVAIAGANIDGHDFIDDAVRGGAAAVLATKPVSDLGVPVIKVKNSRLVLAEIAAAFAPRQSDMIVAITGTNGKTSIAEFLRQIWAHIGWNSASIGTLGVISSRGGNPLNSDSSSAILTTPDAVALHQTLDHLSQQNITHVAMETSSHGLDQKRLAMVKVRVAGFTNLSLDHLDYHPDMDAYFDAKASLFTDVLQVGGVAVVNIDSKWGKDICAKIKDRDVRLITVGEDKKADFAIDSIAHFANGLTLSLTHQDTLYTLPLALNGSFQASNAVMAAAMAHASGVRADHALMSLGYIRAAPGRMQTIHGHPAGGVVIIDYAHTPDALKVALESLRDSAKGNLGVVFGCGGERDRSKRPEMGKIAADIADFTIVTDDNPRNEDAASIRADIMASCPDANEIGNRMKAIHKGIERLGEGDMLLVAGKGHEDTQTIGSETLPFNDETIIRGILANMAPIANGKGPDNKMPKSRGAV